MKAKDLRKLSTNDLHSKINELQEELFKLKFKHHIRKLDNPSMLNSLKKDVARIQTILNESN